MVRGTAEERAQSVPGVIDNPDPTSPIRRRVNGAPRASGDTAYASPRQLASLADYLERLTTATTETGWIVPSLVVHFGADVAEEEAIIIGVRWIQGAYHAEIR